MNKDFIQALSDLEKEKRIPKDYLLKSIEEAITKAYKKEYKTDENVSVSIDSVSGEISIVSLYDVVEVVENELTQISLEEAKEYDEDYEVGDQIEFNTEVADFGRIAAQTAKQVIVQKIREAERGMVYSEYSAKQSEIVTGVVERIHNGTINVLLGKGEGILLENEQVPGEKYKVNDRIKVYVMDVKREQKGVKIYVSRSHPGLVKRLFELEVPEIKDGTVVIKGIAREAGSRTKMAVYTEAEGVDPVGSCVGTGGRRVEAIVNELGGEKIDIIPWSEDPCDLIRNVLSPAKVEEVSIIDLDQKQAQVVVPDYQLSLAIGKEGQNVRLAARVSGWKIDIKSHSQYYGENGDVTEVEEING
ncbi:MAG: transcription termination factor NusA [Clostridia bacterium]|nr:transcription termination factor NusA [Clostridia bacterium]